MELTTPATPRRMLLHGLNSGARVCMADFEDSLSPTWRNIVDGHSNVRDAVHRTLSAPSADAAQPLRMNRRTATLIVRPRGWHLQEAHITVDGSVETAPSGHARHCSGPVHLLTLRLCAVLTAVRPRPHPWWTSVSRLLYPVLELSCLRRGL